MNLYTLPENQKLIWDTISKVPNFQQMRQNTPQKCEQWFREIIQMYYNKNHQNVVDKTSLSILNKETIRYMLKNLKTTTQPKQPVSFQDGGISGSSFQTNYTTLETNANETRNFILEQKQTKLNNEFQMRQQQYSSLFEKPKVDEIDFREQVQEDKPIENMDELIQRQMAEREYDIQNINHLEDKPKIDVIELENEKKVTFKEEEIPKNNYDDKIEKLNKKIDDFVKEFTEKIEIIQNDIQTIKNEQKKSIENAAINNADKIISKLRTLDDKVPEKDKKLSTSQINR